jgi:FSR family fosmidomycin resistance protein-like MFS transporter
MKPTDKTHLFDAKALAAIFLVHFTGDFYQSLFPPLYPVIKNRFSLSLTQIGFLASVVTVAAFVAQPIAGIMADRYSPRRFMMAGLMLSTLFIPLMGVIHWFGILVLVAALGSLGSAVYHPTAAGMVPQFAGDRTGFAMSIFGLGGTIAHSIGPLTVTGFIAVLGIEYLPMSSLMGLVAIVLLLSYLPATEQRERTQGGLFRQLRSDLYITWKAVRIIWLIAVLRSLTDVALRSFYPILFMQDGHALVSMGVVLSLYTAGGSLAALVCGAYVDRRGYKSLYYLSFALATPCLLLLIHSNGFWVYPLSFIAGFVLLATMFPSVALATQIAPLNRSLVSSITLGFAVGTGGLLAPLVGRLAEHFGLLAVLGYTAAIPLLCLPLIHYIDEIRPARGMQTTHRPKPAQN